MTNTIYNIPADILRAALAFACIDAVRETICSVHFAANAGHIVTTDGHTLCRLAWPTNPAAKWTVAFTLRSVDVLQACKAAGKGGRIAVTVAKDKADTYELAAHKRKGEHVTTICATIITGGTFPPYGQVIPEPAELDAKAKPDSFGHKPAAKVSGHACNPNYLARVADLANAHADHKNGGNGQPACELVACADDMAPIRYEIGPHTVVIMPMRR